MRPLPPVLDADACARWLVAEMRAYADDPCSAQERLAPTMALFEQVIAGEPGDFGVALAWHLTDLCGELWRSEQVETVLDAVMPWVEAGFGEKAAVPVLSLRCRMHLRFGRLEPALVLLDRLTRRAAASARAVDQAHSARALGGALSLQRQFEPAIQAMHESLSLMRRLRRCRKPTRWSWRTRARAAAWIPRPRCSASRSRMRSSCRRARRRMRRSSPTRPRRCSRRWTCSVRCRPS